MDADEPTQREGLERRVAKLEAMLAERDLLIGQLVERIAVLEAQLSQNSSNSSRPPSSDAPWSKKKKTKAERKRVKGERRPGGQPGHKGKARDLLPPEAVDQVVELKPEQCEHCGDGFAEDAAVVDVQRHQVAELPPVRPVVTEFQMASCVCEGCGLTTRSELPPGVPRGAFGPRVQGLVALLTGRYRMSRRNVRALMEDMFGLGMSVGSVQNTCDRVGDILAPTVAQIAVDIAASTSLHADETGWRVGGVRHWLWVATTFDSALFHIDRRRNREALKRLVPETYEGIVHSDRWRPYEMFDLTKRQLCHAHLRRDFQALIDRGGEAKPIGEALLAESDRLFHVWHRFVDGDIDADELARETALIRARWARACDCAIDSSDKKARAIGKDMNRQWAALWCFLYVDGVEPTNNDAEQAIRHPVIWRKTSFGNMSEAGAKSTSRLMSVIETARRRSVDLFSWFTDACEASLYQRPPPALAPAPA